MYSNKSLSFSAGTGGPSKLSKWDSQPWGDTNDESSDIFLSNKPYFRDFTMLKNMMIMIKIWVFVGICL